MRQTYQLLPSLSDEQYQALREDIRENGVIVPIIKDESGATLDGYHREKAVADLRAEGYDVPDPPTIVRAGMGEIEKVALVVGVNLNRRHLSEYLRVKLARDLVGKLREEARGRSLLNLRQNRAGREHVRTRRDQEAQGRATDRAAELVGLGTGRTLEKHETVIAWVEAQAAEDPKAAELLEKAEAGRADMRQLRSYRRRNEEAEPAGHAPGPDGGVDAAEEDDEQRVQAHTPFYHVAMTGAEHASLLEWAWSTKDPGTVVPLKNATVSLVLPRPDVVRYEAGLRGSGYPGLASCFAAALEATEAYTDLTSEERAVINRIRRTENGMVEVRVVRGSPKVPPLKHWKWHQGGADAKRGT